MALRESETAEEDPGGEERCGLRVYRNTPKCGAGRGAVELRLVKLDLGEALLCVRLRGCFAGVLFRSWKPKIE